MHCEKIQVGGLQIDILSYACVTLLVLPYCLYKNDV